LDPLTYGDQVCRSGLVLARPDAGGDMECSVMCLTCGCMDAHLEMGESNITFEDIKRAADENGRSVAETLDIMERTKAKDLEEHPREYDVPAAARS
jgi:hypothetical protein